MTIHYASTERESYSAADHVLAAAPSQLLARCIAEVRSVGLRAAGSKLRIATRTLSDVIGGKQVKAFVLADLSTRLAEIDGARGGTAAA